MKWEYLFLQCNNLEMQSFLGQKGIDGWDLTHASGPAMGFWTLIFKKEKRDETLSGGTDAGDTGVQLPGVPSSGKAVKGKGSHGIQPSGA